MKHVVLMVEDDIWLAQMYADALESDKSCRVLHAATADEALEQLDANSEVELIVLDMFLPEHNGIEFLHEIASYGDLNSLPIVVLSSVSEHDLGMNTERWRHYGVVSYLYKPATKPYDLLVEVKKQIAVL